MSTADVDVERLRAHDEDEWLRVEREYSGRLIAYVSRRIQDLDAREDVLQETMLGAVRGIARYDPTYSFEQYLFGICHNRTIDHLRRRKLSTLEHADHGDDSGDTSGLILDALARDEQTPSRIVRGADMEAAARAMLTRILREWVQETWAQGELTRLMVIEALLHGGWRNKDTWKRFGLRDETAVAGIKFRALARLRELARSADSSGQLLPALAEAAEAGEAQLDFGVAATWREARVSCPARHWLARHVRGELTGEQNAYVRFHLDEMGCPWCRANLEDLERRDRADELEPLLQRVRASTINYLRSRTST